MSWKTPLRLQAFALFAGVGTVLCIASCSSAPPFAAPGAPIRLQVDLKSEAQTFEAWRMTLRMPPAHARPEALRKALDSLASDLGITGLRFEIHHLQGVEKDNDNEDPRSIHLPRFGFEHAFVGSDGRARIDPLFLMREILLPLKQRVEQTGVFFSTYVSPVYKYRWFPSHWHDPEEYAEFAEAHVGWFKQTAGFYPAYWAIVNEPDPPFLQTGELVNDLVAVAKRFKSRGFPTRLQAPETVRPDRDTVRRIAENPDIVARLGLLSYHGYDYKTAMPRSLAARSAIRDSAKRLGVRTAMTEVCCKEEWKGDHNHSLGLARDIFWNLTIADVSVWEPLGMFDPGMFDWDRDGKGYQLKPPFYGFRQFAHFIRPGFVRVAVTCSGCGEDPLLGQTLKPVAFRSPGGKVVLVLVNDQRVAQEVEIELPSGSYQMSGVDREAPRGRTYPTLTTASGGLLRLTLPAQAIVTLVQD